MKLIDHAQVMAMQVLAAPKEGTPDYTKYHPDQSAVPKNGIFKTIMQGLMWVGFAAAGIAFLVGLIFWMVSQATGHHMLNEKGKSGIGKALAGGFLVGAFGTIMNFVVAQ